MDDRFTMNKNLALISLNKNFYREIMNANKVILDNLFVTR